ncbi:MAG: RNA polymerase sigma factor [Lachnospiraceae bacterium]|nr:RNA polymerase sigma factor [Lachnospiraceae bacterium]
MDELDYQYLASLVLRAREGDSDAFAEIYAATYRKQYKFARHYLRDEFLAQDAVQEAYIHALKHIADVKDPSLFLAWLNQITFRVCFDSCKKKDRHYGEINPMQLELYEDDREDHNPEDAALNTVEKEKLRQAINELPPMEQRAIVMRYMNEMQIDEIAEASGVSRSTVKRQLIAGREKIRKIMEGKQR